MIPNPQSPLYLFTLSQFLSPQGEPYISGAIQKAWKDYRAVGQYAAFEMAGIGSRV